LNPASFPAATIKRRIYVGLYEMLILLGVWALGYLVPNLLIGITLHYQLPNWFAFGWVYTLFGVYFVWYWQKTGQTLAMQTWRVKLVDIDGNLLSRHQGLIRYAISTLWLVPTVAIYAIYKVVIGHPMGHWPTIELLFFMALFFWPMTCIFDKNSSEHRQSLADRLAKTQLIQLPKVSSSNVA
jgi:uncharacterized RDD family membrane protein YckC